VLAHYIRRTLGRFGFDVSLADDSLLEPEFQNILEKCRPFSMASRERLYAVFQAVRYVVRNAIPGDIVECGVWRGGACMVAALSLLSEGDTTRRLWLYDTYAGMTAPSAEDAHRWTRTHRWAGQDAQKIWQRSEKKDHNEWCYAGLDEVRENLFGTGYPRSQIEFVKGDVGATLSSGGPAKISLLRLDTDWYESTRAALEALYPRLPEKGVLIIDDYGVWAGARQAIDEYFAEQKINMLLQRTDYTGRMGLKP
jgi:O-methyltransferase